MAILAPTKLSYFNSNHVPDDKSDSDSDVPTRASIKAASEAMVKAEQVKALSKQFVDTIVKNALNAVSPNVNVTPPGELSKQVDAPINSGAQTIEDYDPFNPDDQSPDVVTNEAVQPSVVLNEEQLSQYFKVNSHMREVGRYEEPGDSDCFVNSLTVENISGGSVNDGEGSTNGTKKPRSYKKMILGGSAITATATTLYVFYKAWKTADLKSCTNLRQKFAAAVKNMPTAAKSEMSTAKSGVIRAKKSLGSMMNAARAYMASSVKGFRQT